MQAPSPPIIVKIVETNEISGLGDVMLEAIGLTGVIAVGAALFGLVLAVVIIAIERSTPASIPRRMRRRSRWD